MSDSPERPSTPLGLKENEYSSTRENSWQAHSCPRTTSTAICARVVPTSSPTSSPTSIYNTSSTTQREGREGAEEDNHGGRIKGLGFWQSRNRASKG